MLPTEKLYEHYCLCFDLQEGLPETLQEYTVAAIGLIRLERLYRQMTLTEYMEFLFEDIDRNDPHGIRRGALTLEITIDQIALNDRTPIELGAVSEVDSHRKGPNFSMSKKRRSMPFPR